MIKDLELNENGSIINSLASSLTTGLPGLQNIPIFIRSMLVRGAWKKRYVSVIHQIVEFDTFLQFLEAKPPEGLHAKFDDLWQLCRDYPDVQAMLDEAVQGKRGGDRRSEDFNVDNVNIERPAGNSRAYGLRKLRKYAEENPEVADIYQKALSGEISVHKALLQTGLRKAPAKAIPPNPSVEELAAIIKGWSSSDRRRLIELISD